MKAWAVISILICVAVASAQGVKPELPRGMPNATSDSGSMSDSVTVSIPTNDQLYVDDKPIAKDQLGEKIVELTKQRRGNSQIVFIAASANVDYRSLVETMQVIRGQGIEHFRLVVNRANTSEVDPGMFLIEVPGSRDPGKDAARLTPNPLTLVASLSSDLQLRLNNEPGPGKGQLCYGSVPSGLEKDPANLQRWLACLFESRTKQHAYRIGMETRADLPLAERIEKTVFVKASLSAKYGDVVRIINAVKGAGADPIGLQIDDLPH